MILQNHVKEIPDHKSLPILLFIQELQSNNKESIKTQVYWPFVGSIQWSPVDSPHKWPAQVTKNVRHHDDIIKWNFSVLLAICAGNSLVTGEFHVQRPVNGSFDVFFHLLLNKQWWGWWFEMPSCPLEHHCNANSCNGPIFTMILIIHALPVEQYFEILPSGQWSKILSAF